MRDPIPFCDHSAPRTMSIIEAARHLGLSVSDTLAYLAATRADVYEADVTCTRRVDKGGPDYKHTGTVRYWTL